MCSSTNTCRKFYVLVINNVYILSLIMLSLLIRHISIYTDHIYTFHDDLKNYQEHLHEYIHLFMTIFYIMILNQTKFTRDINKTILTLTKYVVLYVGLITVATAVTFDFMIGGLD